MKTSSLLIVLFVVPCYAADTKPKKAEKIDLGIPTFGAVPKGEGMEKPKEKKAGTEPTVSTPTTTYSVVKVVNGKSFLRTATGATPTSPFDAVTATGNPLTTEKFSTVVRVKCPDKKNSDIMVTILDPRGDTTMEAGGALNFRGSKVDEIDYTVDWDPTSVRAAGEFQVMVKVAGQVLGTFPLKVVEKK